MAGNISPSEELRIIEEKRGTLEEAVRIALSIEQMHKGLSAALVMGTETARFPPETLALVDELSDEIRAAPDARLKEALAALEKIVTGKLERMLELAAMAESELLGADLGVIGRLLEDYRKKAQTAVALRVLLGQRGHRTEPVGLGTATERLRQRIEQLDERERHCRARVRRELTELAEESERILRRDDLPEAMRRVVEASLEDVRANIAHLDGGAPMRTLPVAVEIVEMEGGTISNVRASGGQAGLDEGPTVETQTLFQAMEEEPIEIEPPRQQLDRLRRRGFFSQLWHWATTPRIGWREARYHRDE